MTTEDLHKILQDPNYKMSCQELKQLIFELQRDVYNELDNPDISKRDAVWYQGEGNGFQVVLDLLDHLEDNYSLKCSYNIGDVFYYVSDSPERRTVERCKVSMITFKTNGDVKIRFNVYFGDILFTAYELTESKLKTSKDYFQTLEEAEERVRQLRDGAFKEKK